MPHRHLIRSIDRDTADRIVRRSLQVARERSMNPLAVIVLDSGGQPVVYQSEDGIGIIRFQIALGKAYGALGMGTSSRELGDRLAERPAFNTALAAASEGRVIAVAGGVLILNADSLIMGAVGVTGDTSDNDELCAVEGIRSVQLTAEPSDVS